MQARPIPTSPKHREPATNAVALKMGWVFVFMAAMSGLISIGTVLLVFAYGRAFPQSSLVRWLTPPGTGESVIIRQEIRSEIEQSRRIIKAVSPSLSAIMNASVDRPEMSDQLGRAVTLTSDGLAVTLQPDRLTDDIVAMTQDSRFSIERVGALGTIGFLRVERGAPPLSVATAQTLEVGMGVWLLKYDLTSGVSLARATLATIQSGPTSGSLIESSDVPGRRYGLDRDFETQWNGAVVVDADARLIGLIEHDPQGRSHVLPAAAWSKLLLQAADGKTSGYPVLGVTYYDLARPHNLSALPRKGALITAETDTKPAVLPGSPAEQSGLRGGDVISEVDNVPLTDRYSLSDAITSLAPNAKIRLTVLRSGSPVTLDVTLGSAQSE